MSKKQLITYHKEGSPLYSFKFVGGGELPEMLRGSFTSTSEAHKFRDMYYAGKIPKRIMPVQQSQMHALKKVTHIESDKAQV